MSINLFIPAAPKDYIKLPFVLQSVDAYLPDIDAVHICTPTELTLDGVYRFPVTLHRDQDVLPFDVTRFKFRPTWVYQQFLKLFQRVTVGAWYLVMDADKIINRPLPLFDEDGSPILYLPNHDQNHGPYFDYNRAMLGIEREYPHSFLSELTLYNGLIIDGMLEAAGLTVAGWLDKSADIISATCCIGDAELYGQWAHSFAPDLYEHAVLIDERRGKYNGDWNTANLLEYVDEMKARSEVDIFSAHSWHD